MLTLDQHSYLTAIINKFHFADSKAVSTPSADAPLTKAMAHMSSADGAFMAAIPYRSAVGSLLYLAVVTRPDISNAVREVSRYMANPGRVHWHACARIFRYLRGTVNLSLSFDFSAAATFISSATATPTSLATSTRGAPRRATSFCSAPPPFHGAHAFKLLWLSPPQRPNTWR